ncbi:MAG: hypothetical protein V1744_06585 [Candidatus Altiarchaeota archaeon]
MVEKEEEILGAAVLFATFLLFFLIILSPAYFVNGIYKVAEAVSPTSTTTSTTSTTSTTTSTTESTSTTTSSTGTSTSTSTVSTTSSTSTTMSGRRCSSESECGGVQNDFKCKGNSIYRYTTTYACNNPDSPQSQCFGRTQVKVVEACEEYQHCTNGACVNIYSNDCDYRCETRGYELYYCSDECSGDDTQIVLREECSEEEPVCCCITE